MQFSTATIAAAAAFFFGTSSAAVLARAQMCGVAPSASGSQNPLSTPSAATAVACEALCQANSACQSFVFGLPSGASAPTCSLFQVAASQVPAQQTNIQVFDKGCTTAQIPSTAPTTANPVGTLPGNTGGDTGGNTGGNNGNQGQNPGQPRKRNVCGAAPTGPSGNAPSPQATRTDITTQQACLDLCHTTSGCQSVEFGKPSANGQNECRLFQVAASQLPPVSNGQTFVAFDSGC